MRAQGAAKRAIPAHFKHTVDYVSKGEIRVGEVSLAPVAGTTMSGR